MFLQLNSEAVTGQQWNIPSHFVWTRREKQGCWERSQLLSLTLSIFPSKPTPFDPPPPPALKIRDSLSAIRRSQWWPVGIVQSNLVSYIPSVSWFLRVIVQGKTPKTLQHCLKKKHISGSIFFFFMLAKQRTWHHGQILTVQLQFGHKILHVKIGEKEPFLELSQVVRREIHRRNRSPVAPKQ